MINYDLWKYNVRWRQECTPSMTGHINLIVWTVIYVTRLFSAIGMKTRKNMMYNVRRKFASKKS